MTWAALIYQQYPAHLRATPGRPRGRFPVARAGKVSHMPGNVPHMPALRPPVVFCGDGTARLTVRRETHADLMARGIGLAGPPGRATGVN